MPNTSDYIESVKVKSKQRGELMERFRTALAVTIKEGCDVTCDVARLPTSEEISKLLNYFEATSFIEEGEFFFTLDLSNGDRTATVIGQGHVTEVDDNGDYYKSEEIEQMWKVTFNLLHPELRRWPRTTKAKPRS